MHPMAFNPQMQMTPQQVQQWQMMHMHRMSTMHPSSPTTGGHSAKEIASGGTVES